MPEKCIILKDSTTYRQTNKWNILAAKSFTKKHILRGSLLVKLTEAESSETFEYFVHPLNYKTYSDDSSKLYCNPEDVLQLNDRQFDLLLGIRHSFDRFKALNILNWVEKLTIGFGVNVVIPTIPNPVRGLIRYVGPLPGEEGIKFGIELLVSEQYYTNDTKTLLYVALGLRTKSYINLCFH